MLNCNTLLAEFESDLQKTKDILTFHELVVKTYESGFDSFISLAEASTNHDFARKAARLKTVLRNAFEGRLIAASVDRTLQEQSIVSIVSRMEIFLSEVFIDTIGKYPDELVENDKYKDGIKIPKSYMKVLISKPLSSSLGNIILETDNNINFQDLRSTRNTFNECLKVFFTETEIEPYMDKIILMHAIRHVMIHKNGIVDSQCLKQLRNTKYSETYTIGGNIDLSDELINELVEGSRGFAQLLVQKIKDKYEPT